MAKRRAKPLGAGKSFLPTTLEEAGRGWGELDVILVTGDAYVDHPSFAAALLGRLLEAEGFRVGILDRPDPQGDDVKRLGEPRLFFAVSSGAVDSMVSNYTAQKKRRSDDAYAPGGRGGGRPDRATIVYANALRRVFGRNVPILAGGLEVSLRRFAHYDFWSDSVRRSILLDAPVDALVYGMGEKPMLAIARALREAGDAPSGRGRIEAFAEVARRVRGVVYRTPASRAAPEGFAALPCCEEVRDDPEAQVRAFREEEKHRERGVYQDCAGKRVIANPPAEALTTEELDAVYALPFQRQSHPKYKEPVPALEQVQFSVTAHRGCSGGCAFCGISAHQGKAIQSRSDGSVLAEIRGYLAHPDFRGTVRDVGGPTANMWNARCAKEHPCRRPSCLAPRRCPHFRDDPTGYLELLDKARRIRGVKHLFVTTGVRMDLALECPAFIEALARHYTSGHLKVAPEHVVPSVLRLMRKPDGRHFPEFLDAFRKASRKAGKEQYVLPYFIAAHPGCRIEDMVEVAVFLKERGIRAEQCQIFTPLPGTASAVMYATGLDPYSGKPVYVERDPKRREMQKALILWHRPESRKLIREAMQIIGGPDMGELLTRSAKHEARNPKQARKGKPK